MWKGAIQFGLVTIPVKLYLATESKGVSFNMLHETDLSRIQMKIYCPVDDEVISRGDTVRGFEYAPGQYVVDHRRGPRDGPAQDRPLDRDRAVRRSARPRRGHDHVRQAGLLPRARPGRPQGVRPAQGRPPGQGPHGDLQGRDQGSRGARRARPVREHDAPHDPPLARRDPRARASSTCPSRGARDQAGREEDGRAARRGDDRRVRPAAVPRRVPRGAACRSSRRRSRARRRQGSRARRSRPRTSSTSWRPRGERQRREDVADATSRSRSPTHEAPEGRGAKARPRSAADVETADEPRPRTRPARRRKSA